MPPSEPTRPLAWISASEDDLLHELESLTLRLSEQLTILGLDTAAYHRKYWDAWGHLPETMSVAARNRACEYECRAFAEEIIGRRALIAAIRAKYDCVVNFLDVRRQRPMAARTAALDHQALDHDMSLAT